MDTVTWWSDVDWDAMARRARLAAFDLDNTLATSKQPMVPAMVQRFTRLTRAIDVAVVTGGRYELVVSQILDVLGSDTGRERLHLMPTSGSRYYRWDGRNWACVYAHDLSDDARRRIVASLERRAKQLGLWEETAWGGHIEDRGSQITFSALGQQAPADAKQAWDPDDVKKRRLVAAVAADLPEYKVRAGGYTSVDVSLPGMDKSYAIRELSERLGIGPGEIMFVGDRMAPGGNDYPAALAGAMAVAVSGPQDTLRLIDRLLERLPA